MMGDPQLVRKIVKRSLLLEAFIATFARVIVMKQNQMGSLDCKLGYMKYCPMRSIRTSIGEVTGANRS